MISLQKVTVFYQNRPLLVFAKWTTISTLKGDKKSKITSQKIIYMLGNQPPTDKFPRHLQTVLYRNFWKIFSFTQMHL